MAEKLIDSERLEEIRFGGYIFFRRGEQWCYYLPELKGKMETKYATGPLQEALSHIEKLQQELEMHKKAGTRLVDVHMELEKRFASAERVIEAAEKILSNTTVPIERVKINGRSALRLIESEEERVIWLELYSEIIRHRRERGEK